MGWRAWTFWQYKCEVGISTLCLYSKNFYPFSFLMRLYICGGGSGYGWCGTMYFGYSRQRIKAVFVSSTVYHPKKFHNIDLLLAYEGPRGNARAKYAYWYNYYSSLTSCTIHCMEAFTSEIETVSDSKAVSENGLFLILKWCSCI